MQISSNEKILFTATALSLESLIDLCQLGQCINFTHWQKAELGIVLSNEGILPEPIELPIPLNTAMDTANFLYQWCKTNNVTTYTLYRKHDTLSISKTN